MQARMVGATGGRRGAGVWEGVRGRRWPRRARRPHPHNPFPPPPHPSLLPAMAFSLRTSAPRPVRRRRRGGTARAGGRLGRGGRAGLAAIGAGRRRRRRPSIGAHPMRRWGEVAASARPVAARRAADSARGRRPPSLPLSPGPHRAPRWPPRRRRQGRRQGAGGGLGRRGEGGRGEAADRDRWPAARGEPGEAPACAACALARPCACATVEAALGGGGGAALGLEPRRAPRAARAVAGRRPVRRPTRRPSSPSPRSCRTCAASSPSSWAPSSRRWGRGESRRGGERAAARARGATLTPRRRLAPCPGRPRRQVRRPRRRLARHGGDHDGARGRGFGLGCGCGCGCGFWRGCG
jgi:hypothetical protein